MSPERTASMRYLRIGIAVTCCVMLAAGFAFFRYEIKALFWHVTHGSSQQWSGLEIRVPLKYDVNVISSRSIQIFTLPGWLRARMKAAWGAISIIHAKDEVEGTEIVQLNESIATAQQEQGFRLVKTRSLVVAGTPMQCREQLAENFRSYGPACIVHCQAESKLLFVQFEGSAALLDEFYSVASGIRFAAKN